MDDQAPPISLPRYDILEGSGVSTLNRLIQLSRNTGEDFAAELILRDPQSEVGIRITIVDVTLEHDPDSGTIFFNGALDSGIRINGYVRPIAESTGFIGSANIRF